MLRTRETDHRSEPIKSELVELADEFADMLTGRVVHEAAATALGRALARVRRRDDESDSSEFGSAIS